MKKKFINLRIIGVLMVLIGLFLLFAGQGFFGSIMPSGFFSEQSGSGSVNVFSAVRSDGHQTNFSFNWIGLTNKEFVGYVNDYISFDLPYYFGVSFWDTCVNYGYPFTYSCLANNNEFKVGVFVNDSQVASVNNLKVNESAYMSSTNKSCTGDPNSSFNYCHSNNVSVLRQDLINATGRDYGFFDLTYKYMVSPIKSLHSYPDLIDFTASNPSPDGYITTPINEWIPFESRQRIFIESSLCGIPSGYVLASQDFPAGTTITKSDLRNIPLAFCWSYPAMLMDSTGSTLNTYTTEPYTLLSQDSTYTVPANSVLHLMYVSTPLTQTQACDVNYYLDDNGSCVPLPAFEYYCSNGTWSESEHACLVQAVQKCVEGVFDEDLNECVKFIQPTVTEVVCPPDYPDLVVDGNNVKCVNTVNNTETQFNCPEGFNLVADSQASNGFVCQKDLTDFTCPAGSTLTQTNSGSFKCVSELQPVCEKGQLDKDNEGNFICKYFPEVSGVKENDLFLIGVFLVGLGLTLILFTGKKTRKWF